MGVIDTLTTLTKVPMLLKVKRELAMRPRDTLDCPAARVEDVAARLPGHEAVVFEGKRLTWHELNALANRYAHTFAAHGIGPADTVSVMMENRVEFLATLIALNKLGAVGALINTNLQGRQLVHCITVANSKKCIFGAEVRAALEEAKGRLALEEGRDYVYVAEKHSGLAILRIDRDGG